MANICEGTLELDRHQFVEFKSQLRRRGLPWGASLQKLEYFKLAGIHNNRVMRKKRWLSRYIWRKIKPKPTIYRKWRHPGTAVSVLRHQQQRDTAWLVVGDHEYWVSSTSSRGIWCRTCSFLDGRTMKGSHRSRGINKEIRRQLHSGSLRTP